MNTDFEKFIKSFEPVTRTFTDKRTNSVVEFKFEHKSAVSL